MSVRQSFDFLQVNYSLLSDAGCWRHSVVDMRLTAVECVPLNQDDIALMLAVSLCMFFHVLNESIMVLTCDEMLELSACCVARFEIVAPRLFTGHWNFHRFLACFALSLIDIFAFVHLRCAQLVWVGSQLKS